MIYFIQAEIGGPVKIGYTSATDVAGRLRDLQCGSPFKLRCLKTMRGNAATEYKLHQRFAASRQHGEWFAVTDELRDLIAKPTYEDVRDVIYGESAPLPIMRPDALPIHGPLIERRQLVLDGLRAVADWISASELRKATPGLEQYNASAVSNMCRWLHERRWGVDRRFLHRWQQGDVCEWRAA